MKLVRVPALLFENRDLGKPLGDEKEIPTKSGTRERARDLRIPAQLDLGDAPGLDRLQKRYDHERPVFGVSVVGSVEPRPAGQVDTGNTHVGEELDRGNVRIAPITLLGVVTIPATGTEARLEEPRAFVVAPRVPIQMQAKLIGGDGLDVAPGDDLFPRQHLRLRIELDFDAVARVSSRRMCFIGELFLRRSERGNEKHKTQ